MSRPFRFAVQTAPFHDPEALADFAVEIESLGYEELYSYDHVGGERPNGPVDPFVALVVAARATERLRVGPLVLNNEFHHPVLLARTAISVDQMTGGRLVLGIGTGYAQSEHDAIGLELRSPGPRVDRFGESLTVLRRLFDDGECRFDGDHHRIDLPDIGVRPVQPHVPFLIGGHGPRVVALAGRHADIFQFTGLTHGPDGSVSGGGFAIGQLRDRARRLTDAAGERDADIERSALVQMTAVGAEAEAELLAGDGIDEFRDVLDETPFLLAGSVEQLVDKLERLRDDLGISHYVVRDPHGFAPVVSALSGR